MAAKVGGRNLKSVVATVVARTGRNERKSKRSSNLTNLFGSEPRRADASASASASASVGSPRGAERDYVKSEPRRADASASANASASVGSPRRARAARAPRRAPFLLFLFFCVHVLA